MDSNSLRNFIAIVLLMAVFVVWQMFFTPKRQVQKPGEQITAVREADAGAAPKPATAEAGQEAKPTAPVAISQRLSDRPPAPEKTYRVDTPLWMAEFTDRGAALKSFRLKKYKKAAKDPSPVELVNAAPGVPPPLALSLGNEALTPEAADSWEMTSQAPGSITFVRRGSGGDIEKKFAWKDDSYLLTLAVGIKNLSGRKTLLRPALTWTDRAEKHGSPSFFNPNPPEDFRQPASLANDTVERTDTSKAPVESAFEGKVEWAGSDSRYFLAAMMPVGTVRMSANLQARQDGATLVSLIYPEAEIEDGGSASYAFRLFLGPKDYNLLNSLQSGLDRAVDFGWLSVLCVPMLWLLRLFKSAVGNWGVAIIILTILIKVLSIPLTQKSYKSMAEMAKLKPKMDELQKKYKDDRAKLNEETMKLYQQAGVSPLSGCLPMLLQMPIWIALYRMLYSAVELYQSAFIPGWTDNLAEKDPYYILPVLMGVGMFVQQKMTPTAMDSTQAKVMLYFMPIFFTLIMLSLPAGLTLYIFVNTVLSIAQQIHNNKRGIGPAAAQAKAGG